MPLTTYFKPSKKRPHSPPTTKPSHSSPTSQPPPLKKPTPATPPIIFTQKGMLSPKKQGISMATELNRAQKLEDLKKVLRRFKKVAEKRGTPTGGETTPPEQDTGDIFTSPVKLKDIKVPAYKRYE